MDPLSITAAVVGLLSAAGQVGSVLAKIKSSVTDAPESIQHVLSQVRELEACFSAVHKFITSATPVSQQRLSMIQVDQLVATLTESVLTFSKLEAIVTRFGNCPEVSIKSRVEWAWKEDDITRIMARLDRHKMSLSLMLNIVQCTSYLVAEKSQKSLLSLVQQLLESNIEVSQRLQTIERTLETGSILTECFRNGNAIDQSEQESISSAHERWSTISQPRSSNPAFDIDLNNSRVYKRTQPYESDVSFTSSAVRTHSWSILSGLSLSQISSISVIALPVYSYELSNRERYDLLPLYQLSPRRMSVLAAVHGEVQGLGLEQNYLNRFDDTNRPLPSREQCFALSYEQCLEILSYRDPSDTRANKDWEPAYQPQLVRLYMTRMSFAQIKNHMKSMLDYSKKVYVNRYRDWHLPIQQYEREQMIRELFAFISDPNEFQESATDTPKTLARFESPSMLVQPRNVSPNSNGYVNPYEQFAKNASGIQPTLSTPAISNLVKKTKSYKIVLLGGMGVGKTALVTQFTMQHFVESHDRTTEDFYSRRVVIDGESSVLEILDTGDLDEFMALADQWIRDGEGFLLTYSISYRSSFTCIKNYHDQIQRVSGSKPPIIVLVGTKSDRVTEREVSTQEGNTLARELGCEFFETSAKWHVNVEKPFHKLVKELRREQQAARDLSLAAAQDIDEDFASAFPGFDGGKGRGNSKIKSVPRVWQRVKARAI